MLLKAFLKRNILRILLREDEVIRAMRMAVVEPLDYSSSGVDIDLEGDAVSSLIRSIAPSSRPSGSLGAPLSLPGGFGGVVEFGESCLALATDGVGSKLQIASQVGHLSGVGIDCVAMNVNDLICVGAEPIAFVDYIAVPKADPSVHSELGKSLSRACQIARVTLAGGETATLPGIVKELDLSGTALGWFPRGCDITGRTLEEGDLLIGLPSSGIHSNGYTLVRAVLERSGLGLGDSCPFDPNHSSRAIEVFSDGGEEPSLAEVLLNPTRIYVDPVIDLVLGSREGDGVCEAESIKAIAHITGGGLSNLIRLHDSLGWHIGDPLEPQPEFDWLREVGTISNLEMHRTFNMGMGMVIAVSAESAEPVCEWLNERLPGSRLVGEVNSNARVVTHSDPEVVFSHY
ncbi:MAG: phosphoribosylformylglycinamidine cyclo-ligase [Methanobacteriota archaeon]|nr:MAG: phosphoribosylformylglycinamidine cyclo-ligase [Euryarchaeota archaeon]